MQTLPQATIDQIIELTKLNNTIENIADIVQVSYKEVAKVLIDNNVKTMIGLKNKITRDLKEIEGGKTISDRESLIEETNRLINDMYENFKWVLDEFVKLCNPYYKNLSANGVNNPDEETIANFTKLIKRDEIMILHYSPNEILHYIMFINKIRKSTISKRLSKIQSEVKKEKRKLLRLDIEETIDEMYLLYKWLTKECSVCDEWNKINKEIEEENRLV